MGRRNSSTTSPRWEGVGTRWAEGGGGRRGGGGGRGGGGDREGRRDTRGRDDATSRVPTLFVLPHY